MSERSFVFLHGFTGSGASWSEVIAALGARRVLCPNLLGHGIPPPPRAASFEAEVDRIAAEVRSAPGAPFHLVGYSLGARVALGLLVRAPELFRRATLIGVNPGLASSEEREQRIASDEKWAEMLERGGIDAFIDAWEAQPLFATLRRLPEDARARQRAMRRQHSASGLADSLRVLGLGEMPNYWPALTRVRVPLLLVAGAEDAKFRDIAEKICSHAPSRLLVVAGAGHNVPLERPAALAEALRED